MQLPESDFSKLCCQHVLKDIDLQFITRKRQKNLINISYRDFANLTQVLKRDIKFLEDNNIMDYSFMLAIEDTAAQEVHESRLDIQGSVESFGQEFLLPNQEYGEPEAYSNK